MGKLSVPIVHTGSISLASYYEAAIPRAFSAGWDWAVSQGIKLTLVIVVANVIFGALLVVAMRRRFNSEAIHRWWRWTWETPVALVGALTITTLILFLWFFINDAPKQLSEAREQIDGLTQRVTELSPPKVVDPCDSLTPTGDEKERNRRRDEVDELYDVIVVKGNTHDSIVSAESILPLTRANISVIKSTDQLANAIDTTLKLVSRAHDEQESIITRYPFDDITKCIR
jgi:hypothetical protein